MFLSIITINRNNAEGLKKTLDSVASQTCRDFEHIIIDGASTDESVAIINEYVQSPAGKNVSYWISEPDTGIYNAMNKAIPHAQGEYCLFLNSGDWLINENIVQKVSTAGYREDIVYFDVFLVYRKKIVRRNYPDILDADFFYNSRTISHQNTLIKTTLQKEYFYSEEFKIASDADFFIQKIFIEKKSIKHISEILTYFEAENGLGSSSKTQYENFVEWYTICLKFFPEKMITNCILLHDYQYGFCGLLRLMRNFLFPIRAAILNIIKKPLDGYNKKR